jgi:hypothetical protein
MPICHTMRWYFKQYIDTDEAIFTPCLDSFLPGWHGAASLECF